MIIGTYQAYAFCTSLFTSFIISANRFVAIFVPHSLESFFSTKKTIFAAVAMWVLAAVWTLLDVFSTNCYYIYDSKKFIFNLLCPESSGDHFFVASMSIIGLYGIGGLYLVALIKLKYDNSKISSETIAQNMAKRRMKVFWQAFGIWASILVNVLAYHFISPYMTDVLINGIVSVIMILCPPYGSCLIVLIFDSRVSRIFRSFFGHVSDEVTVVQSNMLNKRV
uniref:G-protein coupled receptors family 1 profile domain-containing protein n=1 Tax=Romanomermis culicivorax TaxID=13658 RepID=A0A915HG24_ROMCU